MSKTVDERIVELRFDNQQFERNVHTSMSTLEKLKQSLNFKGAANGLEGLEKAAKNTNLSGLGNGVEAVHAKISALQVMGVTALARITNSAITAGERIAKALTIDPIKSGFQEYETQINAVQTILANTQKEGTTVKDVNGALDELNTYADKTIYNFTEMTRNIGTFTAAGVKLDTSVNAIQGIANLAAVSGSTSQQASTAMYQLSQALASGTVKLMDWNSVVNAGMGGQVFQDALKETSALLGTGAEAAIKAKGSFRESLQTGWLTSEVLTETLKKFTTSGATEQVAKYTGLSKEAVDAALDEAEARYGEADAIEYASKALAKKSGKNADEIKSALQFAKTAEDAATKVKTFSQLWDTLKEAAQSGWGQTWRIVFGDFEEAKEFFTYLSDTFGGLIGASSDARNKVLQEWKDLGGRTDFVDSIKNLIEGIGSIVKPIGEAFREIFPPVTAKQLKAFSEGLKTLTERLKISDTTAAKLKSTFKGVFSVISIVAEVIKAVGKGIFTLIGAVTGLGGGILNVTGSLGDFITKIRDSVVEGDLFGNTIDKIVGFLTNAIKKFKDFGNSVKKDLNITSMFQGFLGVFQGVWTLITKIGSAIANTVGSLSETVSDAFGRGDIFEVINSGLFAAILLSIRKFINGLSDPFEKLNFLDSVKDILNGVKDSLEAWQKNLQAGILLKIASAIGVLALALFVLSGIDPESMNNALTGITVLFVELIAALSVLTKLDIKSLKGVTKAIAMMNGMAVAILILANAMRILSSLDVEGIAKGLVGVAGLVAILIKAAKSMDGNSKRITKFAGQMILLSVAIGALSLIAKKLSSMSWDELSKGGAGILGIVTILVVAAKIMDSDSKAITKFAGQMLIMSIAIGMLAVVGARISSMSWGELSKGGAAILGLITILVAAAKIMDTGSSSITKFAGQMLLMAASLAILAPVLKSLGSMEWDSIGKSLLILGLSLGELAIGLRFMKGTLSGSAALLVAAAALAIITPTLKSLGSMSVGTVAKSLIALSAAFTVIGFAGYLLAPLIPTIIGLAAAFTLFGLATLSIGAGLALLAAGFTALATAGAAGATALVAALTIIVTGIFNLIPTIAKIIGNGIVEVAKVLGDCAPQLCEAFMKLLSETMKSLATYTPQIVDSLLTFLIGVINSLANHMPELITAFSNLIGQIFKGVIEALNGVDASNLLKGTMAVGLMTALMYALSGVVGLIPSAMAGLAGVGLVIAELSLVLAAIGALEQIPGLQWLITEGGNLLETVGTAIGQFVGGIIGGFAQGVSSSFPQIASDLSAFMTNVQPFINGAKNIDPSMMDGVNALVKTVMLLTAADVLNGITSFITGGNSMASFAEQLVPFGEGMKSYAETVSGIDTAAIESSASAAKALAEVGNAIPKEGGLWGLLSGEQDLASFGTKLIPFGEGMKAYASSVSGINAESITASASAAKALAEVGNAIPKEGGLWGLLSGEQDLASFGSKLVPFGLGMRAYSMSVAGINTESIMGSASAAKALAQVGNAIPADGGFWQLLSGGQDLASFGAKLVPFGRGMKAYAESVAGVDYASIVASANAAKAMVKVANSLENSGGAISYIIGDNDLGDFGAKLKKFGNGMKSYSESVSGIDIGSITASVTAAKAMIKVANSLPKEGGLKSIFSGKTNTSALTGMSSLGKSIKNYSNAVIGVSVDAVSNSASAVKKMVNAINSTASVNTSGVKSFKSAISSLASTDLSGLSKTFNASASRMASAGSKMTSSLAKGLKSNTSSLTSAASSMTNSLQKAVTGNSGNFATAGKTLVSRFVAGINSQKGRVTVAMTSMVTAAVSRIRGNRSSMYNAGTYLGSGLVSGINSKKTAAYNAGYALGKAAVKGEKDGQKSNSPSKLTIQAGKWLGEGLVIGMKTMGSAVYRAGRNMGNTAATSMGNAVSTMTTLLEGGIDVEPSIRPVLDLSDIQSGVGAIDGMFNKRFDLSAGVDIDSVGAMMSRHNQNGGMDDVVSAIDGLRKELGKTGNVTNIIDGITYDDGSNLNNAIESIVRAARMGRRV